MSCVDFMQRVGYDVDMKTGPTPKSRAGIFQLASFLYGDLCKIAEGFVEERVRKEVLEKATSGEPLEQIRRIIAMNLRLFGGGDVWYEKRTSGDPDVLRQLLDPSQNPEQLRQLCKTDAGNWPISGGSMFPEYLAKHAESWIKALNDPRFPGGRSSQKRPSNERKQLWFLARSLAGAVYGIEPSTAVAVVGSMRPEELFIEGQGKRKRNRQRS
jgi:hypothetical protein